MWVGMDQVTPRFRSILQFLASTLESPDAVPGLEIPLHSTMLPHEFREGENSLVTLALKYGDLLPSFLASPANTLSREETVLEELDAVLVLMLSSNDPNLWIWVGFRRIAAWKAVRRLAGVALEGLDWPQSVLTERALEEMLA